MIVEIKMKITTKAKPGAVAPVLANILRTQFEPFVRKAHDCVHGTTLDKDPYLGYLCTELGQVGEGKMKRVVVNLPPRHLKTFIASVCLPAWILMHEPSKKLWSSPATKSW
jgi:hypothetical protein